MINLNERFPISPAKVEELKTRIHRFKIDLKEIDEQFIRGHGPGGQKVNKTSNGVLLRYPPLGLSVKIHQYRQRSINRFIALRELVDQIEMKISPETSIRLLEYKRIRRQKARRHHRALKKMGGVQ